MKKKEGLFRSGVLSEKERKNLLIYNLIRRKGTISRTGIGKEAGFNIVTVSNYINAFLEKRFVIEKEYDVSSGGRRPTLLELSRRDHCALGVDVGSSDLRMALVDLAGGVIDKKSRSAKEKISVKDIVDMADEMLGAAKIDKDKVKGIGIGVSEHMDEWLGKCKEIGSALSMDAYVGGSAMSSAYAEKILNVQTEVENMMYIYSDIGYGVIIKGETFCAVGGDKDVKADIGSGPEEGVQDLYYLQPLGTEAGLVASAKKVIERGVGTSILELVGGDAGKISLNTVIEAATKKDKIAMELIDTASSNLGTRVAYLINLFSPELVVIGGGIEKAGDTLLSTVRTTVERLALEDSAKKVKVVLSILGQDAVAIGAACLVIREVFINT